MSHCLSQLKQLHPSFLDFKLAMNRVIRIWYERRIQEETEKNSKLRQLHDDLTRKKLEI